jgi:hypothetical protein
MTPKRELENIKGFTEAKIDKLLKLGNTYKNYRCLVTKLSNLTHSIEFYIRETGLGIEEENI